MAIAPSQKGYRVYSLQTKKLVISRDVEFDEQAAWNWEVDEKKRSVTIPAEVVHSSRPQQEEAREESPMTTPSSSPASSVRSRPPREEVSLPETPPLRVRALSDIL